MRKVSLIRATVFFQIIAAASAAEEFPFHAGPSEWVESRSDIPCEQRGIGFCGLPPGSSEPLPPSAPWARTFSVNERLYSWDRMDRAPLLDAEATAPPVVPATEAGAIPQTSWQKSYDDRFAPKGYLPPPTDAAPTPPSPAPTTVPEEPSSRVATLLTRLANFLEELGARCEEETHERAELFSEAGKTLVDYFKTAFSVAAEFKEASSIRKLLGRKDNCVLKFVLEKGGVDAKTRGVITVVYNTASGILEIVDSAQPLQTLRRNLKRAGR